MIPLKWQLVLIIIACETVGDVLNTSGMKRQGEVESLSPSSLKVMIRDVLRNPRVLGGVAALAASFVALLLLLSIANVSFAVPATAGSYVFETLLAKYVLGETVGGRRWAATVLVMCGVALLQW